jgi:hypothetical protein
MQKCQDTKLKNFGKCKKDALKTGAATPEEIETACLTTIDDGGKCGTDMAKKCTSTDNDALFPGCAGEALAACLDQKVECEVCVVLNDLDGLARNCDEFDDGEVNGSCATPDICGDNVVNGFPLEECDGTDDSACPQRCIPAGNPNECTCAIDEIVVGDHKCVMAAGSTVQIATQALPLPPFAATGAVDISCGSTDINGKAPCDCVLQSFDPIDIIGIGYICFSPGAGCPTGEVDCDGGNALDVTMDSTQGIAACTGNPECSTQCDAHCAGLGATFAQFNSGCGGFCTGGQNDNGTCTDDSDCPGGSCTGKDGIPGGNVCLCDCLGIGGAPSVPGALQCNMGAVIDVEIAPPCGDGDILIAVGTRCIPLTTEAFTSQIHNSNHTFPKDFPADPITGSGTAIDCATLATSTTTGIKLVGAANFFDSTIGDLTTEESFSCE